MARLTSATVSGATLPGALSTRETVATETPACFATVIELIFFSKKEKKMIASLIFKIFLVRKISKRAPGHRRQNLSSRARRHHRIYFSEN
jgi:hypothetical protein